MATLPVAVRPLFIFIAISRRTGGSVCLAPAQPPKPDTDIVFVSTASMRDDGNDSGLDW